MAFQEAWQGSSTRGSKVMELGTHDADGRSRPTAILPAAPDRVAVGAGVYVDVCVRLRLDARYPHPVRAPIIRFRTPLVSALRNRTIPCGRVARTA